VLDYSELVHRAVLLAETDDVRAQLRRQFKAVYVDEYQDTDPAQVRLLQAIAGDGRDLVVVGDPDQSIYAFRGADVRGILEFPTQFPQVDGRPADVVALSTTRRFGERLLTASRRIAHRIGMKGSIDAETFRTFREPVASDGPYGKGKVDIYTFTSSGAETDHIADLLRRAHLEDDVPWSEMAVLVRSGVTSIPGLRRALVALEAFGALRLRTMSIPTRSARRIRTTDICVMGMSRRTTSGTGVRIAKHGRHGRSAP